MTKEKWEISITESVKIQRYDKYNFIILVLTEGKNSRTGETTRSWKIEGYYTTFNLAVMSIIKRDLITDYVKIKSLEDYLVESKRQVEILQTKLKGVKL